MKKVRLPRDLRLNPTDHSIYILSYFTSDDAEVDGDGVNVSLRIGDAIGDAFLEKKEVSAIAKYFTNLAKAMK